jgi:hypothetical protein
MRCRRKHPSFGVLALFLSQACVTSLFAQSNSCPPNPARQNQPREIGVIVDQVELHGNPLSDSDTAALVKEIEQTPFSASSPTDDDWAIEIVEVPIRGALQDNGYFRVVLQGAPYLIRAVGRELHYGLRVEVESGPQYRLDTVRILNKEQEKPLAFSETVLRQQLDLNAGDLFSVSKVRQAMENMTRLYGSKGFIDMVPEPETDIQEKDSRIDLIFRIDEGKSYRIGEIAVVGVGASARKQVQLPQCTGDYFSHDLWWNFFKDHQADFPSGATFESSLKCDRNVRDSTLEVTVDFSACPQPQMTTLLGPVLRTKAEP